MFKNTMVQRYRYDDHQQLRTPLVDSLHKHGRRLKALRWLTTPKAICKAWIAEPERLKFYRFHQIRG